MGRKRTSPIWTKLNKNELQQLLDNSNSLVEVIKFFNLDPFNGNHKTLNQRIKEEGLSLAKLEQNRKVAQELHLKNLRTKRTFTDELIFCVNSAYSRRNLKQKLIKQTLLPYICSTCGCEPVWNNKPLSLQLDHINGVNNDNRLENLRFLCPNCHAQTETFSGKRLKKLCGTCKIRKIQTKHGKFCKVCYQKNKTDTRKFNPTKEEFFATFEKFNKNYSATGRYYNVSDNAIRKRAKILSSKLIMCL